MNNLILKKMDEIKVYVDSQMIINIVSEYYGITPDEVKCTRRFGEFIKAKHIAMYFCRQFTSKSYFQIGHFFNDKDHATVLHAVRSVKNQMWAYPAYCNEIKQLESIIRRHGQYDRLFERHANYETEKV